MKTLLLAVIMVVAMVVPSIAAIGVLDQTGNLWDNATTVANVPCVVSNDIFLGQVMDTVILGQYAWIAGPTPVPEVWFSIDQVTWYSIGAPFGIDTVRNGKVIFRGAVTNGNPNATWMQLRMCATVSELTVTVIGLRQGIETVDKLLKERDNVERR